MIALINTQASNQSSVLNAIRRIGAEVHVTNDANDVERASAILLPGVGAFEQGMAVLRENHLVEPIRRRAAEGTPLMGICLGMQLLALSSDEHGHHPGLGLVRARVVRLRPTNADYRVPNIGWCDARPVKTGVLFPDQNVSPSFYFLHSYHMECEDTDAVAATIDYGGQAIAVAVEQGNLFGVQFHPEKSQDDGFSLLKRFFEHLHRSERSSLTAFRETQIPGT